MSLTPGQRVLRSRIANFAKQAKYEPQELTAVARGAARSKLEQDVIEKYGLDPANPDPKRLQAGISAHYAQLQLASSKARSARAGTK